MTVALRHDGLPEGVRRTDLLPLIDRLGKKTLGLSITAQRLLRQLILRTCDQDYEPGRICSVWCRTSSIAADLGLSCRSITEAECQLVRAGFVKRETGRQGFRKGERVEGIIRWAFGINLAPLIERYQELKAKAAELDMQQQAIETCRAEIRYLGRQIRESERIELRDRAHAILPDGRTARINDHRKLKQIRDALAELLNVITTEPGRQKTAHGSAEKCAPNIQDKPISESCSGKPHESDQSLLRNALRIASEDYQALLEDPKRPAWPHLVEASWRTWRMLGFPERTWGDACAKIGRERAALCVLLIDRNHRLSSDDPYRARNPAGCLAGMATSMLAGTFNLRGFIHGSAQANPAAASPALKPYETGRESVLASNAASIVRQLGAAFSADQS
ncbi:helix-turn-helix domain-containing protein [Tsuneonella suprasediminis]|uniref:helix-turn-helix domain-containing protein n=1 Tax=Tsuneonella suprasediminis TaxID=2306996 RepID=UPI002F91C8D5